MASSQTESVSKAENSNSGSSFDLSKKGIPSVPPDILKLQHLKYLYLEGNNILCLPDNFFIKLCSLQWLDVRHNKLQALPGAVGKHAKLATLLLEGNQLRELPLEIGEMKALTGLSLAGNPLEDPPPAVVNKGLRAIKLYCQQKLKCKYPEEVAGDDEDCDAFETDWTSMHSSSDEEFQHKRREGPKKAKKLKNVREDRPSTWSATSADDSASTEGAPTMYKPPLPQSAPPLDPAYYGSVLGDMPPSYIIKAWRTGSYFTRQRKTGKKHPAMAE